MTRQRAREREGERGERQRQGEELTGYPKDCQQFLGLAKGSCRSHAKNEKKTKTTEPKTALHFWH